MEEKQLSDDRNVAVFLLVTLRCFKALTQDRNLHKGAKEQMLENCFVSLAMI